MPRYFFHLDSVKPYHDVDGTELRDDAAAWKEAKRFTRDIETALQPGDVLRLEVRREGQSLYLLAFSSSCLDPGRSSSERDRR